MYSRFIAGIVGFALAWQTRWLFLVPHIDGQTWDFGIVSLFVSQVLLFVWLAQEAWTDRKHILVWIRSVRNRPYAAIAAGFVSLFCVIQLIVSDARWLTLSGLVSFGLVWGLVSLMVRRVELRLPFLGGFLISATMQAILSFVQLFTGASFASTAMGIASRHASDLGAAVIEIGGNRHLRAYGGQPHPNVFGAFMLIALFAFAKTVQLRQFAAEKSHLIQFTIIITAALFFSFSRSAWIAFALCAMYAWRLRARLSEAHRVIITWAIRTFVVLALVFAPVVLGRVVPQSHIEQQSVTQRVSEIAAWKRIAREHWLFGTGVWAYSSHVEGGGYARVPVHSVPLLIFAEIGVIGIQLLWAAWWMTRTQVRLSWWPILLLPLALFDHYTYSLWAGLVIVAVGAVIFTAE